MLLPESIFPVHGTVLGNARVEIEYMQATSKAMAHNQIPLIRRIAIGVDRRDTEEESTSGNIQLTLTASQDGSSLISPISLDLPLPAPGGKKVLDLTRESKVRPTSVTEHTETVHGILNLEISIAGQVVNEQLDIRALTTNEWFNSRPFFESLVAFIQPNDLRVINVVKSAREILEQRTGDGSLQGYQAGTKRALEIAAGVYDALRAQNIYYMEPPASFEQTGQRIRPTGEVLEHGLGTCIDLSLTYAAVAEQVGLRPVVFIIEGHAFTGVLVDEDSLQTPVEFSQNHILNAVRGGRVLPVEAVGFCAGKSLSFEAAVAQARQTLESTPVFGMISVFDSRRDGIRPLPSEGQDTPSTPEDSGPAASTPSIPEENWDIDALMATTGVSSGVGPSEVRSFRDESTEEFPPRIHKWRQELLDLSFNNRLLNLKPGKEVLDLILHRGMLAELDDFIHSGEKLTLLPQDAVSTNRNLQGLKSVAELEPEFLVDELSSSKRVYAALTEKRYKGYFTTLKRTVRTLQEETGSSNLFLTLGAMLIEKTPGDFVQAPLFLIPVKIVGGSGKARFQLTVDASQTASPNYCLVEWLAQRQNVTIDALASPRLDASGLDIEYAISEISRELLRSNLPFTVVDTASIAIAKFSTYGMWKDLTTHWKTFLDSPVFRHIALSPGESFVDPAGNADLRSIEVKEEELALPIAADGAQLRAVTAAGLGRSFVLEGPPGTGKSQTITNLIAHCLEKGQRILFVAEKQAALDVVRERLDRVGLKPFTLNLHGVDQKPGAIRQQLKETIDAELFYNPLSWDIACTNLKSRLEPLVSYPGKIHEKNGAGYSLWDAAAARAECGDGVEFEVSREYVSNPALAPHEANEILRALAQTSESLTPESHSLWQIVGPGLAETDANTFLRAWRRLESARALAERYQVLADLVGQGLDLTDISEPVNALSAIPEHDRLSAEQVREAVQLPMLLRSLKNEAEALTAESSRLREVFSDSFIHSGDTGPLLEAIAAAGKGLFGKKKRLAVYGDQLRGVANPAVVGSIDPESTHSPTAIAPMLHAIPTLRTSAQNLSLKVGSLPYCQSLALISPLNPQFSEQLEDRAQQISSQILLHRNYPWLDQVADSDLVGLVEAAAEVSAAWADWTATLDASDEEVQRWASSSNWLWAWLANAEAWGSDIAANGVLTARRVASWAQPAKLLRDAGLADALTQLETRQIPATDADMAWQRGLATASIKERVNEAHLEDFTPEIKADQLVQLSTALEAVRKEAAKALPASLLKRRPYEPGRLDEKTGELRRLLEAKRNARSFRSLFRDYSEQILSVAPCFFVSPSSLANYVEPGSATFDVVVFDEASQVTVDQAMGALGRGRSAIIVGDSKQMPPTRIGKANLVSEEDVDGDVETIEQIDDLESILAEAVESQIPRLWLTWHYRSQDESLIAFSNSRYYEGQLASLPSPGGAGGSGVELRRVPGQFIRERGSYLRTNPIEAKAIVDEVIARLNSPATANESLGIVTFNLQQRNLVLDLLENCPDPLVQERMVPGPESIFIKNLENVQGDERDVVLFSLAFSAKSDGGPMPLNFGPLTRAGGEKRLNVALTRARRSIVMFSSFDPQDINLSRTSSRGMADLRAYMEMARDGMDSADPSGIVGINSNLIRDDLSRRLREHGWDVATDYGLSSFTIDLAVKPKDSDQWHVAVLLDGPRWNTMPTVSDRDLTPQLLRPMMKWASVIRVWLPQWLEDPEKIISSIEEEIVTAQQAITAEYELRNEQNRQAAIQLEERRREAEERQAAERAAKEAAIAELSEESGAEAIDETELQALTEDILGVSAAVYGVDDESVQWEVDDSREVEQDETQDDCDREAIATEESVSEVSPGDEDYATAADTTQLITEAATADASRRLPYEPLAVVELGDKEVIEGVLTDQEVDSLRARVRTELIDAGGPIRLESLRTIIAKGFGRQKTSAKLNLSIDKLIPRELLHEEPDGTVFAWPTQLSPSDWAGYRAIGNQRNAPEIPLRELVNAMEEVHRSHSNLEKEKLFRITLGTFNLKRLTGTTQERLELAFAQLSASAEPEPGADAATFAVVDLETTGFGKTDRVLEIAIVDVSSDGRILSEWSTLVNPKRDIPNSNIHGITATQTAGAPTFEEAAGTIAVKLNGKIFVAHNANFDARMLGLEFLRAGFTPHNFDTGNLCTLRIAGNVLQTSSRSLNACLEEVGLQNALEHSALADAHATAELFSHFISRGAVPAGEPIRIELSLDYRHGTDVSAIQRSNGHAEVSSMARILDALPQSGNPAADSYLSLLDQVMLDRHISTHEQQELLARAMEIGMGTQEVHECNRRYLHQVILIAKADNRITGDELAVIEEAAQALALTRQEVDQLLEEVPSGQIVKTFVLNPGDRVTFTGATEIPRESWEHRAIQAGLEVGSLTKATTVLIAADPDTESGKAQKARSYGIPIANEKAFAELLGELTNRA